MRKGRMTLEEVFFKWDTHERQLNAQLPNGTFWHRFLYMKKQLLEEYYDLSFVHDPK